MYYRLKNLNGKTADRIQAVFVSIPRHVSCLDLRGSNLGRQERLADTFESLPQSISSLDLSENEVDKFSAHTLEKLKNALPLLKIIFLTSSEAERMSALQLEILRANVEIVLVGSLSSEFNFFSSKSNEHRIDNMEIDDMEIDDMPDSAYTSM